MNDTSKTPATGGGPDGPKDEFSFTRGMDFFLVWLAWLALIGTEWGCLGARGIQRLRDHRLDAD